MSEEGPGRSQRPLRIGDTILLYLCGTNKGYISSFLTSKLHSCVAVQESESMLPNVHCATFKVITKKKYRAKKYHQELQLRHTNDEELMSAERQFKLEERENLEEQKRLEGTPVVYGECIQLVHTPTEKYLAVSTECSRTEQGNLKVELLENTSDSCIFKLLPKFKLQNIGDHVQYNDQVMFRCFTTEQFLHCSDQKLGSINFSVLKEFYELNVAAVHSAIKITHYYQPLQNHPSSVLRAGSTVRLFHREHECYIAAEGSFWKGITEDVHCRKRRLEQGRLKPPSTSPNTYWQFEKENNTFSGSGEPLLLMERCRIKHLPSRRYLSVTQSDVEGKYNVTLEMKDKKKELDTVFTIHPVLMDDEDFIQFEQNICIKHASSKTWLHLIDTPCKRKNFSETEVQWDHAELFTLGVCKEITGYSDALTVEEVKKPLMDNFTFIEGIIPILTTFREEIESQHCLPGNDDVIGALKELSEFIYTPDQDPVESKMRQKIMRSLQVLELILQYILSNYDGDRENLRELDLCKTCYEVLNRYLEGDSRKNENYLARHIDFFLGQVCSDIDAEKVMIQMVEDNPVIVNKMAEEPHLQKIIEHFKTEKDSRFMDFLSNLCVCGGRPNPRVQRRILKKLNDIWEGIFYYIKHQDSKVFFKEPQSSTWEDATQICGQRANFLNAQLKLCANMCKGFCTTNICDLESLNFFTFESLLQFAKSTMIPCEIRLACAELIKVMYVEVGDNTDEAKSYSLSFVYNDVTVQKRQSKRMSKAPAASKPKEDGNFDQLSSWITTSLKNYYAVKEEIATDHSATMSRTRPVHGRIQCSGRYSIIHKSLMLAKVFDVLEIYIKFGYYKDLETTIGHLVQILAYDQVSKEYEQLLVKIKKRAMEIITICFDWWSQQQLKTFICDFCDDNEQSALKDISEGHLKKMITATHNDFPAILIKNCKHLELRRTALYLLNKYHSSEEILFKRAMQSQLLTCNELECSCYKYCSENLTSLRRLMAVDADSSGENEIMNILDNLAEFCVIQGSCYPHLHNQKFLFNSGVLTDVMSYVVFHSRTISDVKTQAVTYGQKRKKFKRRSYFGHNQEMIISHCFKFLRALACQYKDVQMRLFKRMGDLLTVGVEVSDLAELLTEVFSGQLDICLHVQEEQVEKLFSFVIRDSPSTSVTGRVKLIQTLQTLMKETHSGLPIKRNQWFVIKQFNRKLNNGGFFDLVPRDPGDRKKLLEKEDGLEPEEQLYVNITDLLASCCEGKNLYIQSVCRRIFAIDDILSILECREFNFSSKKPFLRLLTWAYISNDKGILNESCLWQYMKELLIIFQRLLGLLKRLGKFLERFPIEKAETFRDTIRQSSKSLPAVLAVEDERQFQCFQQEQLLSKAFIQYFSDGVLPFLKELFGKFLHTSTFKVAAEVNRKTSVGICATLLQLSEYVTNSFFTFKYQVIAFESAVSAMLAHRYIAEEINKKPFIDVQMKKISDQLERPEEILKVVSVSLTHHQELYSQETRLNERFQKFVQRYQEEYDECESPAYSEHISKDTNLEGKLPRGPNFTSLCQHFLVSDDKKDGSHPAVYLLYHMETCQSKYQMRDREIEKSDELVVRCLQILRAIVYKAIVQKNKKQPTQQDIQGLGQWHNALKSVIPLLSSQNEKIVYEALASIESLLYPGKSEVHKGLDYLLQTQSDLCESIQRIFERATIFYQERCALGEERKERQKKFKSAAAKSFDVDVKSASLKRTMFRRQKLNTLEEGASVDSIPLVRTETCEMLADISLYKPENQDSDLVKLTLRTLGLMCDSQNVPMQNYLRRQEGNTKSRNIVAEVAHFLGNFLSQGNILQTADLVNEVLQALIEFCGGNCSNQLVIYEEQIIDNINRILQWDPDKVDSDSTDVSIRLKVKASAVELLEVILEERNKKLAKGISLALDKDAFQNTLTYFYKKYNPTKEDVDEVENGLFRTYHTMLKLADYCDIPLEKIKPMKPVEGGDDHTEGKVGKSVVEGNKDKDDKVNAWEFCEDQSRSVEVKYNFDQDQKQLPTRVFFKFDKKDELRTELKEKVRWKIKRDSPEEKLKDFLKWMKSIKKTTDHQNDLQKKTILKCIKLNWFLKFPKYRHHILLLVTILLNIFVLCTFAVGPLGTEDSSFVKLYESPETFWFFHVVRYMLGGIHLILSLWMVIEYFLLNTVNFVLPKVFNRLSKCVLFRCCIRIKETWFEETYSNVPIFGLHTIYNLGFLLCSFLPLLDIHLSYFYSICLLHIVVHNDILQRVLRSLTKSGLQLLWVAVLGLIGIYIFTIIFFAVREVQKLEETDHCRTLLMCLFLIFRIGLLDSLTRITSEHQRFYSDGAVIVFEVLFYIFLSIVILNLVLGIIVDTFQELRLERNFIVTDEKTKCFICNFSCHDFEGNKFEDHVQDEHNMWNYIYYFLYLSRIDSSKRTSIESYVHSQIEKDCIDFFPLRAAKSLNRSDDKHSRQLQELTKKVNALLANLSMKERKESVRMREREQREWEEKHQHTTWSRSSGPEDDGSTLQLNDTGM